ncbi:MAG: DNA repair protein [Chloroflexota bacterium]|nr:DNA repair protein [Chloroflexota bacterium]
MGTTTLPDRLTFTGDDEADRLLVAEPLALLIGFALDQQVTVQKAFFGPLEIRRRAGTLDAAKLAAIEPEAFADLFRQRPAIHRFPGSMAGKVQALCAAVARDYAGDASRIWTEASDARDLEKRLLGLPGIGPMKAKTLLAILGKRFGIKPAGWDEVAPKTPTLGDVDSPAALARYQAGKRAYKAVLRAGGTAAEAGAAAMATDEQG